MPIYARTMLHATLQYGKQQREKRYTTINPAGAFKLLAIVAPLELPKFVRASRVGSELSEEK